jgi:osmotically-inducible protein OsmY
MRALSILAAAAAGAVATYFFDPEQGRRRRAITRDRLASGMNRAAGAGRSLAQDLRHRSRGAAASLRGRLSGGPVDDSVLAERVRAAMGHNVSHASIDVQVAQGEVTLRGPILESEAGALLRSVRSVPGVRGVVDRLEPHSAPGNVPGLQG